MASRAVVFFGPDRAYEELLRERIDPDEVTVRYLDSIRVYNTRIRGNEGAAHEAGNYLPSKVDNCVVRASDYGSVVSHAISNFASILEGAFEFDTVYAQNPPARVFDSLKTAYTEENVECLRYSYPKISKGDLPAIFSGLSANVMGQEEGKRALVTSLYKLSVLGGEAPSVLLFYGPSGVGKTETARVLSESLGGGLTRIQFSMMQTQEAYEYLFGAEHSKASFARDLLGRESNVVLIDEFDKVNPGLYNMFYQVFDDGTFVDTNYEVDMRNSLFILTSNFASEAQVKRALGPAMFSRISECVAFGDLELEHKRAIARAEYDHIISKLDDEDRLTIEASDIAAWFFENAGRYDNMRAMKHKVSKAIFERLSASIVEADCNGCGQSDY